MCSLRLSGDGFTRCRAVAGGCRRRASWHGARTDLCVYELGQSPDELRRCIQIVCEKGIVDELADRVPECRLEALQAAESALVASVAHAVTCLFSLGGLVVNRSHGAAAAAAAVRLSSCREGCSEAEQ